MKELTKLKLVFMFMALIVPGYHAAQAATLIWDAQTITSPLTVERSATQGGPYSVIATLPTGSTQYILTPGAYGWYRVGNIAGPSNVVQFSLDLYTGLVTDRLTTLETELTTLQARVTTLEAGPVSPPPSASYLTVRDLDATHVEIVCNGLSMRTTGSGLRRVVECVR